MKLSTFLSIGSFASLGLADESQDAAFLTALVSDVASNSKQYIQYFMTASNLPKGLTQLAEEVATYTDDSCSTLAHQDGIDITAIMEYATRLPWYSRLQAESLPSSSLSMVTQSGGSRSAYKSQASAFLSELVSDIASNRKQYIQYFKTAGYLPKALTQLVNEVATYTDDSYSTLAHQDGVDITAIMQYVTHLPWYTRLQAEGISLSGLSMATESGGSKSAFQSQDAAFLTALVSDVVSNSKQYIQYFMTASNLPKGLTQLADEVATYTDDSYTTLAHQEGVDITAIMEYATHLPWYSRIEAKGLSLSGLSTATQSGEPRSASSKGDAGVSLAVPGSALVGAIALLFL